MSDRIKMTASTASDLATDIANRPEPSEQEKRESAESVANDLGLDPEVVEAAGNAKAAEVEATSKKVAEDVAESVKKDERPKKKSKPKHSAVPRAGSPKQEPTRRDHDPLQGATIDPDENYPKILHLIVTAGKDDKRSMEEFANDVKDTLVSQADAKMTTILLQKVHVDGKHILYHNYEAEVERLRSKDQ